MNLKFKWRQELKATIKSIPKEDLQNIEKQCFEDLKNIVINSKNIKIIACYISTSFEININSFIKWAIENDYKIFLPVADKEQLFFRRTSDLKKLKLNSTFNVYEPINGEIIYKFDLMIIPILGYSSNNHRLGYGKGYYDKFLSNNSNKTLGIGFKQNKISENIFEEHDITLDNILLF